MRPPENMTAVLRSAGYGQLRFTRHHYFTTRECLDLAGHPAYEHVWVCDETGEERRWGIEARTTSVPETN